MKDCDVDYCQRPALWGDYCNPHGSMIEMGMDTARQNMAGKRQKKCDYPKCLREHDGKGLCKYHLTQYRSGVALTPPPYTSEWLRYKESLKD